MIDLKNPSEIMNYDVWGPWSPSVGPNAPLDDSCAPIQDGSAMSAVKAWTGANFPANKIVLGVAAYGHSYYVTTSAALESGSNTLTPYPAFVNSMQPPGDSWDSPAGVDQCGNPTPVGGIFNFWGLVEGGFLTQNGTPAAGIDYRYDNCSQTVRQLQLSSSCLLLTLLSDQPYVYNPTSHVMVSFDNAQSFGKQIVVFYSSLFILLRFPSCERPVYKLSPPERLLYVERCWRLPEHFVEFNERCDGYRGMLGHVYCLSIRFLHHTHLTVLAFCH